MPTKLGALLIGVCMLAGGAACAGETLDMEGYTASYALNSVDWRPKIKDSYGEIRVLPNGSGGETTCSEFTLVGADVQAHPYPEDFAAMTWRDDCNTNPPRFIFQGLVTGGAPLQEFAFDPANGWPSFILYPDRSAWFGGDVEIGDFAHLNFTGNEADWSVGAIALDGAHELYDNTIDVVTRRCTPGRDGYCSFYAGGKETWREDAQSITLSVPLEVTDSSAISCPMPLKLLTRTCIEVIRNGVAGAVPWVSLE